MLGPLREWRLLLFLTIRANNIQRGLSSCQVGACNDAAPPARLMRVFAQGLDGDVVAFALA